MRHSDSRLDEESPLGAMARDVIAAAGQAISRNPFAVGGATAFLVTLFYVSANAVWNQPGPHRGAIYATRAPAATERVEPRETVTPIPSAPPARLADPVVERVQSLLRGIGYYGGTVDGIVGPQTRQAIQAYQMDSGLEPSGEIDDTLVDRLRRVGAPEATHAVPAPLPRPRQSEAGPEATPVAAPRPAVPPTAEVVARVQAGLRAFGHEDVEIDGLMGQKTRGAIREFQRLFGLPVTGEPDAELAAKMREIGLTN